MASPSVLHWHFLGCRVWFWVCFAAVLATSFSAFINTLHFTLHTVHFLLRSILDTLRSTLCTLHSTLHTFHPALYTLHSTLYNPHFTLYTLHSSLNTRLSSRSTHASSSGSAGGSPSIILCNKMNTILHLCKLGLEGGILDGGTGRRRAQSRTTIIILTCNGKT